MHTPAIILSLRDRYQARVTASAIGSGPIRLPQYLHLIASARISSAQ
jgi:hypothetical protein